MPREQAGWVGEKAPALSAGLQLGRGLGGAASGLPGPAEHAWLQPGPLAPSLLQKRWGKCVPTSSRFTWVLSNSRRVSSSRILASCLLTKDLSTMDCSRNSTWLWRACSWGAGAGKEERTEPGKGRGRFYTPFPARSPW